MKAKLEFNLKDFDEEMKFKRTLKATDAYIALHDIQNEFRNYLKYNKDIGAGKMLALPDDQYIITERESKLIHKVIELFNGKFHQILEYNEINLDDLE